ncbi:MscS family membrane protein [Alteribacillus persepolensis]|uniref:MscS family membrane protein n=1 Tax=Alteribacillus persepolensis TaxID=568899 RepID=A0A1G7Y7K6_9BACI|nr:mechanosensitive ion channel family protein [Alteribacillus persepolensis]SDG92337.1 MscS family membrane protein [Alteribacillus persepolensis]
MDYIMDYIYNAWDWFLHLPWVDIGIAVVIFLLFFVFRKLFTTYIFKIIMRFAKKSPTDLFTNLLVAFEKPIRFFIGILGIYLAILYLPIPREDLGVIHTIYRSVISICIGWGLFNYVSASSTIYDRISRKIEDGADSMLIPFLSKLLRFIIVALTITVIAYEWNYDINGFIAGLGLGGLAFALAAQDTLSNFFGGVIIVTERPFKNGDWIQTPTVEGIVEDISFRSTKVRTFEDSLVTVPNRTLAHEAITNWSEMDKRLISFTIGVEYKTSREKLERVVQRIEDMLYNDEDIDKELIIVRLDELAASSYDIFLYFFTKTTAWVEWYNVKQQMILEVIRILEEEDVQVAFPSRSLYMEKNAAPFKEALGERPLSDDAAKSKIDTES